MNNVLSEEHRDAARRSFGAVLAAPVVLTLHRNSAGGTYLVRLATPFTTSGDKDEDALQCLQTLAVFKPRMEEIGQEANPHGNTCSDRADVFVPGSGCKREVLAHALDHRGLVGVPPTVEVLAVRESHHLGDCDKRSGESGIVVQVGSLQLFKQNCVESADVLPGGFRVSEVHSLAIFDIRTLNGDRHGGNILVERSTKHLVPVDHSYICPSGYADPDYEWLAWPQSRIPFSEEHLKYIRELDAMADAALVRDALKAHARPASASFTVDRMSNKSPMLLNDEEEEDPGEDTSSVLLTSSLSHSLSTTALPNVPCSVNTHTTDEEGAPTDGSMQSNLWRCCLKKPVSGYDISDEHPGTGRRPTATSTTTEVITEDTRQEQDDRDPEAHREDDAEAAVEVIICTTRLLQIAALEFGCTARDIGHLCRRPCSTHPSFLEEVMEASRDSAQWCLSISAFEANVRQSLAATAKRLSRPWRAL